MNALFVFVVFGVAFASSEEGVTDSPVGSCPDTEGYLLPDANDDTVFYVCTGGVPVRSACAVGTVFDSEARDCVTKLSPVGECPPFDGDFPEYLPDAENKTIFYECSHGIPRPLSCPPGLEFNVALDVCDWPALPPSPEFRPDGDCPVQDGPVPVLLGDELNCDVYYVCYAGKPFLNRCPAPFLFNREKSYCDFPQNVICRPDVPA